MYTTSEARKNLADLLGRVAFGGERIHITRHGKTVAVLVSADDARWLEELDHAEDDADLAAIRESKDEPTESFDEVLRRHGFDPDKFQQVAPLIALEDEPETAAG